MKNSNARLAKAIAIKTLRRRIKGENVSDQQVLQGHRDLPELGECLNELSMIRSAIESSASVSPFLSEPLTHEQLNAPIEDIPLDANCIAGYLLQGEISRGGQAVVYRGVRLSDDRDVAIKVIYGGPFLSATERSRFERESHILSVLNHPHIVKVHDSGVTDDGSLFLVMDYVNGSSIDRWVDDHADTLTPADVIRLFLDVLHAVKHVHDQKVIHRDLKPANIIVDHQGHARVLDFGLSRLKNASDETSLTVTGQFLGSFAWASPEQQAGGDEGGVDERSDIYALGLVLARLVTGVKPLPAHHGMRSNGKHIPIDTVAEAIKNKTRKHWDISPSLRQVLQKSVSLEKTNRQPSVETLANELEAALANQVAESGVQQINRRLFAVAGILICCLLATVFVLNINRRPNLVAKGVAQSVVRNDLTRGTREGGNTTASAALANIPKDAFQFNGHSYQVVKGSYTWDEANQIARSKGGNLLAVNDGMERDVLLFSLVYSDISLRRSVWWIGLSEESVKNNQWTSGEPLGKTYWRPDDEPGHIGASNAVCSDLASWSYLDRNRRIGFIIEWPIKPAIPKHLSTAVPTDAIRIGNRAYKMIDMPMGWKAARDYCEYELGGVLASFESLKEEQLLMGRIGDAIKAKNGLWVGGMSFPDGEYWQQDRTPPYANWLGTPTSSKGIKAIYIDVTGWRNGNTSDLRPFICMWDI